MSTPEQRELVSVFDTQQETEAMVIQGLLESAGIESLIRNLASPQDVLPGVGGVQVWVAPDSAEEAKRVIDEYRNNPEPEIVDDSSPGD
jgi:hypothetical protein